MTRRQLTQAHTYRDLHQHFQHHPNLRAVRNGGRHTVYCGPHGSVPVPNHTGDVKHGTLRGVVKLAQLAGLAALVLGVVLQFM